MMIWIGLFTTLSVLLMQRYLTSTFGKGVIAIREDEIAAEIMGVNTAGSS